MIGKRPTPVIGISPVSGNRTVIMDGASSPRSPLDLKIQSPRGVKGFDFGGVGLAVVASLDDNKYAVIKPVYNTSSIMSISIPVNSVKFSAEYNDNLEDYTVVTCRGGDKRKGFQGTKSSVFDISPAKFVDLSRYPDSDFLNSCHLCNKKLHGKDIFMYRGEKAFCSTECRCRQIVMDEHKEKCTSQFSTSTYANGQIFSTGILAL